MKPIYSLIVIASAVLAAYVAASSLRLKEEASTGKQAPLVVHYLMFEAEDLYPVDKERLGSLYNVSSLFEGHEEAIIEYARRGGEPAPLGCTLRLRVDRGSKTVLLVAKDGTVQVDGLTHRMRKNDFIQLRQYISSLLPYNNPESIYHE